MTHQSKLPVIFLINLDRSPARLKNCSERLSGAGLVWQRFAAVSPLSNKLARLHPLYDPVKTIAHFGRHLSRGEIGCFLSHYELIKQAIAQQLEYVLILEDDMAPKPDARDGLVDLLDWMVSEKPPIDWVHLSRPTDLKYARIMANVGSWTVYRAYRPPLISMANLWTLKGMNEFVTYVDRQGMDRPIDNMIRSFFTRNARAATLNMAMFDQDSSPSVIKPDGGDNKERKFSSFKRKVPDYFYAYYHRLWGH
jgi:glycosyl transferase, family 25